LVRRDVTMNVGILGAGYVGLTTGICLGSIGHKISIYDLDENKINQIQKKNYHFLKRA